MVEKSCKKTRIKKSYRTYSAANKGRSMVNYCQSLVFDYSYLSCNDHCGSFSKTISYKFFEQSSTCFLGI